MSPAVSRWRGGLAAVALLVTTGVALQRSVLVVSALVPLAYLAVDAVTAAGDPSALVAQRQVTTRTVPPGEVVGVRTVVRNEGAYTLADVRVVDRVPDDLAVAQGTPRGVATLGPGESLAVEYALVAKRGDHAFGPVRARVRGAAASSVETVDVETAGAERLACRLDAERPPLQEQADRVAGQLPTGRPGRGLEFHSVREYRPSDPANRIDWRHYARRGELATVQYRQRRSATLVFVVDARPVSRVVAGPGRPAGTELCAYAATQALSAVAGSGHDVGLAVLTGDGVEWVAPGGGREHRDLLARRLGDTLGHTAETHGENESTEGSHGENGATDGKRDDETDASVDTPGRGYDPDASARPPEGARRLAGLAPPGSQLLVFTPALDDAVVAGVRLWGAYGYARSVLAPDVLADNTAGGSFEAVRRRTRLLSCRTSGARAVDWRRGTPLAVTLEYALADATGHRVARPTPGGGR